MIGHILNLLHSEQWYGTKSEVIEIAKGKYQLASNLKIAKRKIKRVWLSRK